VWYPILARPELDWFHRQFARSGIGKIFVTELRIFDEDSPKRLNGSGMLLINPPWQLDTLLAGLGPWLWQNLSEQGLGGYRQWWLVPE
jgi:23S rRNA (adenine2030-N6)-methyltransferase